MKTKYFLLVVSSFLTATIAFAQPANNDLCSPASLTVNGGCTSGTNVAATNIHSNPTCWAASNDVWFSFVATTAAMTITTDYASGTLTDTQIALYSSSNNTCTGTLTQIACDDDGGTSCNLCSTVNPTTLVPGNTYFVRVDGYSTNTGTFCIGAYDTPLANELTGTTCATATIVYPSTTCGVGNSAYNYHSGTSTGGPTPLVGTNYAGCDNETSQYGGWSTFTATATSTTVTNITAGANQNPMDYTIFTGTCGALTAVNCYSVAKGGSTTFTTTVGTTYYVLTTLQSGATTGFRSDHCITSAVACTPPVNDACATATTITANTAYQVTNNCATPDGTLCAGSNENNIWFSWTVPAGWAGPTYFQLYDQNCGFGHASSGMQVSVYNAGLTCTPAASCISSANPITDEDITLGWNSTPGQTYLITYDGYGGEVCTMNFAITDVVTTLLLPVKLLNFDATYSDGNVKVKWVTETETNNDYFTIERSKDLVNFEVIDVVKSTNGNSNVTQSYNLMDKNPIKGISYYRLKQTDYDGQFVYFTPVAVSIKSTYDDVTVYPNPVSGNGYLTFSSLKDDEQTVVIYDVAGRLVYQKQYTITTGNNKLTLETNNLTKGMYFIKLDNAEDGINFKFIKE